MASNFNVLSTRGVDNALSRIHGDTATYIVASTQVSSTVTVIFNEFVGAIDSARRAIFTVPVSQGIVPVRGDSFQVTGESDVWYVVDVRFSRAGEYEIRADGTLERA